MYAQSIILFIVVAVLYVTATLVDEFHFHRKACSGGEMWMHSVLYILHPLLLFIAMLGWEDHRAAFLAFAGGATIYLFYQVTYWNLIEVHRRRVKTQKHYAGAPQDELYDYFGE